MENFESKPCVSFEVEKVIGISNEGNYQVQWAPAWVSRFQLVGCEHLIQEFLQQQTENMMVCERQMQTSKGSSTYPQEISKIQTQHPDILQPSFGTINVHDNQHISRSDNIGCCKNGELLPNSLDIVTNKSSGEQCQKDDVPQTETHSFEGDTNDRILFESNELLQQYENEFQVNAAAKLVKMEENEQLTLTNCTSSSFLTMTTKESTSLETVGCEDDASAEEFPVTLDGYETRLGSSCDLKTDVSDSETLSAKQFKCQYCNDSFSQKSSLNEHLLAHIGNEICVCKHCDMTFDRKSLLQQHLRSHTSERPFACSYCESTFTNNTNLRHHLRTHTGEKPFTCDECGKSFTQKSNLVSHQRTHSGVKPYSCEICGRTFAYSNHRNQHFRRCASRTNTNS